MSKHDLWEKFKDYFTDILGGAIMLYVSFGIWVAPLMSLPFIPLLFEGVVGLLLGFVLLMFPDGVIISFIKGWARKKFGEEDKPES